MEHEKIGALLRSLRMEQALTQIQVARALQVSDKTVSKWERGMGCPDVALLPRLSQLYAVPVERLLQGALNPNDKDGGNMKRIQFYACEGCGNLLTSTGAAEVSCCGRRLEPLKATPADTYHQPKMEAVEDEVYITIDHEMTKGHHLAFAAVLNVDRVLFVRLYPEQDAAVRIPNIRGNRLYLYCTKHGLQYVPLKRGLL